MTKYRYTGFHPQDFQSGEKVIMAAPGDYVDLEDEDIKNGRYQEMLDNGTLMGLSDQKKAPATGGDK